jgi:hypothetical protein
MRTRLTLALFAALAFAATWTPVLAGSLLAD